jgi:hypothetical protein
MRIFKRFLSCGLICFSVTTGLAQFNDTTNYYLNVGSTGIVNKTNDRNSWILNSHCRFSLYKKRTSLNSATAFIFGEQQGLLSNRDLTSSLDFNYYLRDKPTYFWGLGNYEKNFSLKIDNRTQAGLGLGYNLLDTKKTIITLSDGILYERSDLRQSEEGSVADYETFRNSFRLKFRFLLSEFITIDGSDFLQHSLSDRKDYIIRSQTNLSFKVLKWLSFTSGVTYNKLSVTGRENLLVNFGLIMERYF